MCQDLGCWRCARCLGPAIRVCFCARWQWAAGSAKVNWDSDIDQEEGLAIPYLASPCFCNLQGLEAESTLTSWSLFVLTGSVCRKKGF